MASLTIANVKGIPVRLHWTFLLVLPVFAYLMARVYFSPDPLETVPTWEAFGWGAGLAVFLFGTVLLHELGHSLTALRYGIGIRHITLLPIGGVSAMEETPQKPRQELAVTAMGPVVNFIIGIPLLAGAYLAFGDLAPVRQLPPWQQFVVWGGLLSVFIGAFNMFVPAFPMDGGRLLRAFLAERMGFVRATRVAATVGRTLAVGMAIVGVIGGGVLLIVIAFFVWLGAGEEERSVEVTSALGDIPLSEIMTRDVDTLSPDETVSAVFERMISTKHLYLPVMEEGRVLGFVTLRDIANVPHVEHEARLARDVMRREFATLPPTARATDALRHATEGDAGPIAIVDEDGTLVGIVSRTDIVRTVQILNAENGEDRDGIGGRGRVGRRTGRGI